MIWRSSFLLTRPQFASIEMAAACGVANAPVLYRLIVDRSQKIHSSVQTRSSTNEAPGYWFSANRESRRTRQATENDELEFTGLRESPMAVGSDSRKNPSSVDVSMWDAEDDHSQEERSWEWRAHDHAGTVVELDSVESIYRIGDGGSHDQEQHQPAGLTVPPPARK